MKRLFSSLFIILFSIGLFAKNPIFDQDIKIIKSNPRLYLNNAYLGISSNGRNLTINGAPLQAFMTYPIAGISLSTGTAWGTSITNNSTNWNTAYTDRLKWNGGSTGLVAATGRTSLGGTTVGQNIFTLANPGVLSFLQINADNTVSAVEPVDLGTIMSLQADTSNYGFQVGGGAAGDTALFRTFVTHGYVMNSLPNSLVSDTIVVDSLNCVCAGTTPVSSLPTTLNKFGIVNGKIGIIK